MMASSKLASVRTRTLPSFAMAAAAVPWRAAARAKTPTSKRFIVLLCSCVSAEGRRVMRVMSGAPMGRATKASDVLTQASRDVAARGGAVW